MKNILLRKKASIIITIFLVTLTVVVYVVFKTKCFGSGCDPDMREGLIVPFFWFGLPASIISAFFLFFSQAMFVSWLKRVASWYLPVLLLLAAATPLHSGHIMSVDRSAVVFVGMVVLGLISVVYAFVMRSKV